MMNAQITSAEVRFGGYQGQMLSLYVAVKFDDGFAGMVEGHYSPYLPPSWAHHRESCPLGHIIYCWLQATGCQSVAEMGGKAVRIELSDSDRMSSVPLRVGHIIDDDKWFSTKEICERFKKAQP